MLTQVPTRWLRLRLFQSIRPTIKYQIGKANVVADALSQSQRKTLEDSRDDLATKAAAVEEQALILGRFSVELTAEDLQKWTKLVKMPKAML